MTPLASILRERIRASGPLPFSEFMRECLYHPEFGYYRRQADPFGSKGDFYTAEQMQPVFGRLIGALSNELLSSMNIESPSVVELGAGRSEMAPYFAPAHYVPVDWKWNRIPESFSGLLFANEFFDAIPVDVARRRAGTFHPVFVDWSGSRFIWRECGVLSPEQSAYLDSYAPAEPEELWMELPLEARRQFNAAESALQCGFLWIIDYGYDASELRRLPKGTLMSYRRHAASDDVLGSPGLQDITAHICFTDLKACAERSGLQVVRDESLRAALLHAGERDQFAAALAGATERERLKLRLQLKSLLFGMGETFRSLLLKKERQS